MNEVIEKQHTGDLLGAEVLTDQEEIDAGKAICARSESCMWDIGEWYLKVQEARKICIDADSNRMSAPEICEAAGYSESPVTRASRVFKYFGTKDDRTLPFSHYTIVLPLINKKGNGEEAARLMIQEAKKGEKFEGEFEKYGYKEPWSQRDITRAVKIARGQLTEATPVKSITQSKDSSLANMKEAITAELGKAKAAKLTKQVEGDIKRAFAQLEMDYHSSLDKMLEKRFKEEIGEKEQELVEQRDWINEKLEIIETYEDSISEAQKPINCLMTELEFKKLLSFFHEDHNIGNEKKAKDASLIVQKLGKSFQPKHLTKKDLEIQGWKK